MNETDLDWDPPQPGMYNGRFYGGNSLRVSNGKRLFLVELSGTEALTERNISVFALDDESWIIKSGVPDEVQITSVSEVYEALLQIYPKLVPKVRIIPREM